MFEGHSPFEIIHIEPQPVQPFRLDTVGTTYIQRIAGGVLDAVFIGWNYERGGYLASILKRMKVDASHGNFAMADQVGMVGWPILIGEVEKWIEGVGGSVTLIAVPSRWGTAERLAQRLSALLESRGQNVGVANDEVLRRTDRVTEMKSVEDWKRRDGLARRLFRLDRPPVEKRPVLLVDDVIASGASVRTCAALLREMKVPLVGCAALSGSPGEAPRDFLGCCG